MIHKLAWALSPYYHRSQVIMSSKKGYYSYWIAVQVVYTVQYEAPLVLAVNAAPDSGASKHNECLRHSEVKLSVKRQRAAVAPIMPAVTAALRPRR